MNSMKSVTKWNGRRAARERMGEKKHHVELLTLMNGKRFARTQFPEYAFPRAIH